VKVQLEGGPFKVDSGYESVLKPTEWNKLPRVGEAR
jgi:hypothetical protein